MIGRASVVLALALLISAPQHLGAFVPQLLSPSTSQFLRPSAPRFICSSGPNHLSPLSPLIRLTPFSPSTRQPLGSPTPVFLATGAPAPHTLSFLTPRPLRSAAPTTLRGAEGHRGWGRGAEGLRSYGNLGPLKAAEEAVSPNPDQPQSGRQASRRLAEIMIIKTRFSSHVSRKIFHCGGGFFVACLRAYFPKEFFVKWFGVWVLWAFFCEVTRMNVKSINAFLSKMFQGLMRAHEKKQFSTIVYFQVGVWIISMLYSLPVALIGIVTLAVGDPTASAVGRKITGLRVPPAPGWTKIFQKKLVGQKSVAGTLGFVVMSFACNCLLWLVMKYFGLVNWELYEGKRILMALAASVAGALAEMVSNESAVLKWKRLPLALDDNLLIPLAAAFAANLVCPL